MTAVTLLAGKVAPLSERGRSAIAKAPVDGPVLITLVGLAGDEQADLKNHGGPEKAVHHYPHDHYGPWGQTLGPHPLLGSLGAFGENISTSGLTEAEVCVGDIFRLGSALLQVSQGRQPCWKLGVRFGRPTLPREVQETGRTGWYYRVLEEGTAQTGDALSLVDRPRPDWPLTRLIRLFYVDKHDWDGLLQMSELPELNEGWRATARRRLDTRTVEDWSGRLGE